MAYFTFWFPSSFVSRLSEKCQTSLGVWRWSSDAHGWRLDTSSLCCRRWPFWSTEDSDRTWLSDVFNWRLRRHSCACRWNLRPQNVQEVVKWSSQGSHLKIRSKIPGFFLLFFMFVKVTNRLLEKKNGSVKSRTVARVCCMRILLSRAKLVEHLMLKTTFS